MLIFFVLVLNTLILSTLAGQCGSSHRSMDSESETISYIAIPAEKPIKPINIEKEIANRRKRRQKEKKEKDHWEKEYKDRLNKFNAVKREFYQYMQNDKMFRKVVTLLKFAPPSEGEFPSLNYFKDSESDTLNLRDLREYNDYIIGECNFIAVWMNLKDGRGYVCFESETLSKAIANKDANYLKGLLQKIKARTEDIYKSDGVEIMEQFIYIPAPKWRYGDIGKKPLMVAF